MNKNDSGKEAIRQSLARCAPNPLIGQEIDSSAVSAWLRGSSTYSLTPCGPPSFVKEWAGDHEIHGGRDIVTAIELTPLSHGIGQHQLRDDASHIESRFDLFHGSRRQCIAHH